jgi:TetR/AcrR family transcriptional repressor of nem operon
MKVSRDQVVENRRKILAAAARLFAERGFETVSLAEVMNEAGLTHGGFYGHFSSKVDLVAQACAYAVRPDESTEMQTLLEYSAGYLSAYHRDHRAEGCPFAALGSDAGRQPIEARHELTEGLRRMIDRLSQIAVGKNDVARRAHAITSFSTMLGALVLARMTDDPELSDEVLTANRAAMTKA